MKINEIPATIKNYAYVLISYLFNVS